MAPLNPISALSSSIALVVQGPFFLPCLSQIHPLPYYSPYCVLHPAPRIEKIGSMGYHAAGIIVLLVVAGADMHGMIEPWEGADTMGRGRFVIHLRRTSYRG